MRTVTNGGGRSSDEATEERRTVPKLSFLDLLDPSRPWLLVPDGSFAGYFDWVPPAWRVGPWSVSASLYITGFIYLLIMSALWNWSEDKEFIILDWKGDLQYYPTFSAPWCYNLFGFLWMMFICRLIIKGPMGYRAWVTYTVQSWTLVALRHGLCVLLPFAPDRLLLLTEALRFPALATASITFVVWNLVLVPYVYFVALGGQEEKRRNFWSFITSFRLVQLHGFSILFAVTNAVWAAPPRTLLFWDFYLAAFLAVLYALFYLLVLDRIGVHLYPIFSPRTPLLCFTWTFVMICYVGTFYFWKDHVSGKQSFWGLKGA